MRKTLSLLVAVLAFVAMPLRAQLPQTFTHTATITVTPSLSCSVSRNLDFGEHFRSDGAVISDAVNYAQLDCTSDPGNSLSVSYQLPSVLTKQGGGATVPISFGNMSARLNSPDFAQVQFDPALGLSSFTVGASNTFALVLGLTTAALSAEAVTVNVSSATSGVYDGQILVTIGLAN